jgi:hypothetical protein
MTHASNHWPRLREPLKLVGSTAGKEEGHVTVLARVHGERLLFAHRFASHEASASHRTATQSSHARDRPCRHAMRH